MRSSEAEGRRRRRVTTRRELGGMRYAAKKGRRGSRRRKRRSGIKIPRSTVEEEKKFPRSTVQEEKKTVERGRRGEEDLQRKRKAEEELDDGERAHREEKEEASKEEATEQDVDKWKDFCAVEGIEEIEEEDAQRWVCELSHTGVNDAEQDISWEVEDAQELDPTAVAEARQEELAYMKARGLWRVVPTPVGVVPVSVRWVDVLKAEGITRSRLVARDFRGGDRQRDDLFAATPPLEAIRVLISRAAIETPSRRRRKLMFIDAKKAHLNPRCEEDVYIELPAEAGEGKDMCGKLEFWLYGFRKAASEWEKFYSGKLEAVGFQRGQGCPVLFCHRERDVAMAVHGDDFVVCGFDEDLRWAAEYIGSCFDVKVRAVLGEGRDDDKEVTVLGRTVRWCAWGLAYEADEKHRRVLLDWFGLDEGSKALEHNGEANVGDDGEEEQQYMPARDATAFRACVARLNFLGQDSPELQFPAKELSKEMSRPTVGSWARLKKTVRFLVGRRRVVWRFVWQEEVASVQVFADSDWGGDRQSRKSTSGGTILMGGHCLRTWSSTQSAIALSSAEAEFYALIDAVLRAKWMQRVLEELGVPVSPIAEAFTDSSAAKSFVSKRGLGRMRHLELRDLWLQREVGEGKVLVRKVAGDRNPADAMTKFLSRSLLQERLGSLNIDLEWVFGSVNRGQG